MYISNAFIRDEATAAASFTEGKQNILLGAAMYNKDFFNPKMEDLRGGRFGTVQFKMPNQLPTYANGKSLNAFWTGHEYVSTMNMNHLGSPITAMEYLSRSWSPSASDFLQIFSSNNLLLSAEHGFLGNYREEFGDSHRAKDNEGESETEEPNYRTFLCQKFNRGEFEGEPTIKERRRRTPAKESEIVNRKDSLQALFAIDRPHMTAHQRNASTDVSWLSLKHIKGWLRGKPLTNLLRWHKERRKEELRLHTAKIDAALSVAQLAAAVAGITGTSIIGLDNFQTDGALVPCDNSMGNVVSFAAALVATVCAEAAEIAGAPREHVASAINSGFATQTPEDMVTLTATAATCLRGAATLRSRTIMDAYFQESKVLLASGTPLSVITSSGHRRHRLVSIHINCGQLSLSLTKKYLGALISCREYTILDMMEEARKFHGYYLTSLQTDGGDIKLLFQNEKQTEIWMSAISNFLEKHSVGRANYGISR